MQRRSFVKIFVYTIMLSLSFFFISNKVEATYPYCEEKVEGTEYYNCGNYVYTYPEDTLHSSIFFSSEEKGNILYAGEDEQGRLLFYSNGLRYYNVSYDDTSKADNNLWTTVTSKGHTEYDGSFKDTWLYNDSHQGYRYYDFGSNVYVVKQYEKNGQLVRTMIFLRMYGDKVEFTDPTYDDGELIFDQVNEILESKEGIRININAKLGIQEVSVKVNSIEVSSVYENGQLFIDAEQLNDKLSKGNKTNVEIKAVNIFGNEHTRSLDLLIVEDQASIEFSTMSSVVESSSRRIVITAMAGKGKQIDEDYCWYYWSESPDDSLTYDDFLTNYSQSTYKGSYSADKGVILRNTSGTYYLYALAKDDDSWVVKRSEGYVLNSTRSYGKYTINDGILIVSILIVATMPILIYICIKRRGY